MTRINHEYDQEKGYIYSIHFDGHRASSGWGTFSSCVAAITVIAAKTKNIITGNHSWIMDGHLVEIVKS